MKSTSAPYLLPLFLSVGLPVACSSSTDKVTPREGHEYGEAGAAGSDGQTSSGGSKTTEPGAEGGAADGTQGGSGGSAGGGVTSGGSAGAGGAAGSAPDGGGQNPGGANAGGEGGSDGGSIETPVDPTLDGADDTASGRYRLHYKGTQQCLVSTAGELWGAACSTESAQELFLDGAADGFVRVRGVVSNECIYDGESIGPSVCAEDAKLQFVPLSAGYFQLKLSDTACLGLQGDTPTTMTCSAATAWSLDAQGTNFALKSTWTATSTFSGYSVNYAHDGDQDAGLSGHSWTNDWQPPSVVLPQEVTIDLGAARQFSTINVYTSQSYEIGSYDIDYWNGQAWSNLVVVKDNTALRVTHTFPTRVARKLRFVVRRGPEAQFIYARLNEVEIY